MKAPGNTERSNKIPGNTDGTMLNITMLLIIPVVTVKIERCSNTP
jgi:hypothetical protein